jgi:RNA polymerase sigma factor (sigma-70 family)
MSSCIDTIPAQSKRRKVSDQDFQKAWRGLPEDEDSLRRASDNRSIISAVLQKYSKIVPPDELERCGYNAMWRCLQYHDDKYGQKFTTSLHRFTEWECRRALQVARGGRGKRKDIKVLPLVEDLVDPRIEQEHKKEDLEHVRECIDLMPEPWQRKVIQEYYLGGMTMEQVGRANGYSKETARKRIQKALNTLRRICLSTLQAKRVGV